MGSLISPEYLETQKQLHENIPSYGTSSNQYAGEILELLAQIQGETILDYGCGKGDLATILGRTVREYDPAIPGKDAPPEPADLVCCTDVLEHIEPDKLDAVLEDIRCLAKRAVFLVIDTGEAFKRLPDGRNAHLIIEDAKWWREKLDGKFDVKSELVEKRKYRVIAHPYLALGEIKGKGAVDDAIRNEQVRINCGKVSKRIKIVNPFTPHKRVAIIMCYGPSLEQSWPSAVHEKIAIDKAGQRADIVSVSGAHDYLIGRGIVPRFHVECDPRKHKADMIKKPHRGCEYLMASCVHPDIIQFLLDRKRRVRLWHLDNGEASKEIAKEIDREAVMVGGGGSVGLRSIPLMMALGYRRFIVHGMDCSFKDGASHAGHHTGKKQDHIEVRMEDGRKFYTSPQLVSYLRSFDDLRQIVGDPDKNPTHIEIVLRGDGMLQHALRVGGAGVPGPMPEIDQLPPGPERAPINLETTYAASQ